MPKSRVGVHTLPQCKDLWGQIDTASQEQAIRLASGVWNTPEHEIGDNVPAELLHELESAGIIDQDNGKWRFAPAEMLFYLQAIDLINSLALKSQQAESVLQELQQVIESARDDPINRFRDCQQVASFILAELVNEHGREDILEFAISDEVQEQRFWDFYYVICSSLPILEINVQNLAKILRAAEQRAGGDLAGGRAYSAVEYLGRFRPDFALQLVDHLVKSADKTSAAFLERLLTGIAKSSPENLNVVIATCKAWLESEEEPLCQAGICCSQNLILDNRWNPDWLFSQFDSLISRSDDVRYTLAVAVTTLGANFEERSEECLGMLKRLKVMGPIDGVTYGVAHALSRVRDEAALRYKVSCLTLLEDVPTANKGTIKRINRLLCPIAHTYPDAVWNYFKRWVQAHDGEESIARHDLFSLTIRDAYQTDPNLGKQRLTRWFSSADLRLVENARSILRELEVYSFDAQEINSLPSQTIVYITEKLLVGHFQGIHLMRLFHSTLRNTCKVEELTDYFSRVLQYLAWNYPASAKEFFDQVIDEQDPSTSSTLLQEARHQLEVYQAQHRAVFVPELSPSKRRMEKYRELENKRMQIAQEAVLDDDRFPLQKLVSRVAIGRGDRTFHMNVFHPDPAQRRTFTKPRGFGQFFESIELPRGETIDPEGEAWRRFLRSSRTLDESQADE